MEKDTKIVIGAIAILLVLMFISSSGITGQAWFRFWRTPSKDLSAVPLSSGAPPVPVRS